MKKIALLGMVFWCSVALAQELPTISIRDLSFAPMIKELQPAVVSISAEHNQNGQVAGKADILSDNPALRDYFLLDEGGRTSLGSGFVIDAKGYIVTNYHVIKGANDITISFDDGSSNKAQMVGYDEPTDLAVLKVDADHALNFVEMGDSDELKVGDWVLASGNPFGLGTSFSFGIVSAKSRDIDMGIYDNFIQTDAAINQGSSGGALFDMSGKVVGINTALFSSSGGSIGVGFAVPANLSKFVIGRLLETGKVERAWIGLKVANNENEITISDNETFSQGVLVISITSESPAEKSGVLSGDIIMSVNGGEIKDIKDFSRRIAEMPIGREIILRIWRSNQIKDITLQTQLMPQKVELITENEKPASDIAEGYATPLGIVLSVSGQNVVVQDVLSDSQAYAQGLKPGAVINQINSHNVSSIDDVMSYIGYAGASGGIVQLNVIDNGEEHNLNLELKSE